MDIFLIRHGDKLKREEIPTSDYALSELGKEQVFNAAVALNKFFKNKNISPYKVLMLFSPTIRTKESASIISKEISLPDNFHNALEVGFLTDTDLGALDKHTNYILNKKNPNLAKELEADFRKNINSTDKPSKIRRPYGESALEVERRVSGPLREILSDASKNGVKAIIIVSHRSVITGILKAFCKDQSVSKDWINKRIIKEVDFSTGSVQRISGDLDKGFLHRGFLNGGLMTDKKDLLDMSWKR